MKSFKKTPILCRSRGMRKKAILIAIAVAMVLYGLLGNMATRVSHVVEKSVNHHQFDIHQHHIIDGPAAIYNNSRTNWTEIWPDLPTELTRTDSCSNRIWTNFISGFNKEYGYINRDTLRGTLTKDDKHKLERLSGRLKTKDCEEYLRTGFIRRPTVRDILKSSSSSSRDLATFVTQLGYNRFDRLELVLETWQAPVSAAVYIPYEEIPGFIQRLCECQQLYNRSNVVIHLVIQHGKLYPMNMLRNVALNGSRTALSYLSDVDFIPSSGLVDTITSLWQANQTLFDKNVIVVPSFEIEEENYSVPKDKSDVIKLWDEKHVIPARETKWPRGHLPTDYTQWRTTEGLYKISFSEDYEPYIFMKTSLVPRYSEHFVERYKDKSQQLLEVWLRGFNYLGLGSSYAIHYPHTRSKVSTSTTIYQCALAMNKYFQAQMKRKYKWSSIPQYQQ